MDTQQFSDLWNEAVQSYSITTGKDPQDFP
jgi:hypothetical protein